MSDFYTARVLAQLELAERHLREIEQAQLRELETLRASVERPTLAEREDDRQREQFLLGQIDGLVLAQVTLRTRRRDYSQSHLRIRLRPSAAAEVTPEGTDL